MRCEMQQPCLALPCLAMLSLSSTNSAQVPQGAPHEVGRSVTAPRSPTATRYTRSGSHCSDMYWLLRTVMDSRGKESVCGLVASGSGGGGGVFHPSGVLTAGSVCSVAFFSGSEVLHRPRDRAQRPHVHLPAVLPRRIHRLHHRSIPSACWPVLLLSAPCPSCL